MPLERSHIWTHSIEGSVWKTSRKFKEARALKLVGHRFCFKNSWDIVVKKKTRGALLNLATPFLSAPDAVEQAAKAEGRGVPRPHPSRVRVRVINW